MIISAVPVDADAIVIDITLRAKLSEWKQLRAGVCELRERTTIDNNLMWAIVYRLDDVIAKVERQHTNYEERKV